MELQLIIKNQDLSYCKVVNGKWEVNGKKFNDCSFNEKMLIWEKSLAL
jgi:hypothetical protein